MTIRTDPAECDHDPRYPVCSRCCECPECEAIRADDLLTIINNPDCPTCQRNVARMTPNNHLYHTDLTCPTCGHADHTDQRCGGTTDEGLHMCACSFPNPDNYTHTPPPEVDDEVRLNIGPWSLTDRAESP